MENICLASIYNIIDKYVSENSPTQTFGKLAITNNLQGVSKKGNNAFQESYSILLSSQEIYLCSQKTEASPVVLHIITFHSSKYCLRYIKSIFMIDHIEVYFYSNLWIFLWSLFNGFET